MNTSAVLSPRRLMAMRVTAHHLVDNLSGGLYAHPGQCVAELIRNSAVASMNGTWKPQQARIEIFLEPHHPLSPNRETALVVLDHGCGLTDPALERYFSWLGTRLTDIDAANSGNGASQKGIGRLAALALNENCLSDDPAVKVKNGYYLFSRTGATGNIRFVPVIPAKVEDEGGFDTNRFIPPGSTELGSLKNVQGSFTAIVIPTPVFGSHAEVRKAIEWLVPREQDKMYRLTVDGVPLIPPPLEDTINVSSKDGRFRARLGVGDASSTGAWLCDEETALRVASCVHIGRVLPEPLWFNDVVGDIFAPHLLRYQTTARNTLAREFIRRGRKEWKELLMFLVREVAPAARALIERDLIRGDAAETLDELVGMFHDTYGQPDAGGGIFIPGPRGTGPKGPRTPRTTPPPGGTPPGTDDPRRRRVVSIKVRDETYVLYRGPSLNPFVFAQVPPNSSQIINVNVRGNYRALPKTKQARREHCLMQILYAIGQSKSPSDPYEAMRFANEVRSEFDSKAGV